MNRYTLILTILLFGINGLNAQDEMLLLKTSGKVVIGDTSLITTPGLYNLYVQNGVLTEKVKVSLRNTAEWSDDAFDKTPSLDVVEQSIKQKSHLVDIPSATEVVKNGYEVTDMDAKLLQQIEWLWQHLISLEKENQALKERIHLLEKK